LTSLGIALALRQGQAKKETPMRFSRTLILTMAALTSFAIACKSSERQESPPKSAPVSPSPSSTETPGPPGAAKATLTDAQIAAIVVAANQVDIDNGVLAERKSKNDDVKKFAERMVTDHTGVNKAAVELVTKLGVTPAETDASRGLTTGGDATRHKLDALDGAAFDRAYVDNEVAYHKAVIEVLDTQLIPSATNAELKKMLVGVRPAFVAHLEHAQQIQASLAKPGA
jgi:putative membrane protein